MRESESESVCVSERERGDKERECVFEIRCKKVKQKETPPFLNETRKERK